MTVSSQVSRNDYVGDGATSVYPYTFRVFADTDVAVFRKASSDTTSTALTLGTDYTVDGVGNSGGGNVTLTAGALADGDSLTIRRHMDILQQIDLRNQEAIFNDTMEDGLDRLTMISQQLAEDLDRSIKVSETATGVDPTLPTPEAAKFIRWNANADGLDNIDMGSATLQTPADLSVSTAKIIDAAVTAAKLASLAVATGNLQDAAVTTAKVADAAVTTAKVDGGNTIPQLVGILLDLKAAGANGGDFTSGAWRTRALNTLQNADASCISLSANQFTLQPGTYLIEALAPAFHCGRHQAKIINVTDLMNVLIGTSDYTSNSTSVSTHSRVFGVVSIAAAKTFELQHQCSATEASDGFGLAANFGVSEIYSVVKVWRLL